MSSEVADRLANRATVLGNIAIVSIPEELSGQKPRIVEAIVKKHKGIRSVLNKISKVADDARVPQYEILYGHDTVAHYQEHGFIYCFDVATVFFNPRMSFEHKRIAGLIQAGEDVLIPFCGAGPFVIPAAARGCRIIAIDNSREACRWLAHNVASNHVKGNVDILNADVTRMPLKAKFDRAIVPAPYGMDGSLEAIAGYMKPGGTIHFYTFKKTPQIPGLIESYRNMGLNTLQYRACGNVARGVKRWAFDLKVTI